METFGNKKNPTVFSCEPCDYKSYNKKDFAKHCDTKKHLSTKMSPKKPKFCCSCCGKEYKERTGLWKHNKICNSNINNSNSNSNIIDNENIIQDQLKKEMFMMIVKENSELKNMIMEVIKNIAYRNSKMLSAFREKHPDCCKSDSKYADKYNKLVIEAMD